MNSCSDDSSEETSRERNFNFFSFFEMYAIWKYIWFRSSFFSSKTTLKTHESRIKLYWNINKNGSKRAFPINFNHVARNFLDLQSHVCIKPGYTVDPGEFTITILLSYKRILQPNRTVVLNPKWTLQSLEEWIMWHYSHAKTHRCWCLFSVLAI